jgi:hypothetical protein
MFPNKFRNTFGFPCTSVIFVAEKIFSVLSNYGESGWETMHPALSTVGKHGSETMFLGLSTLALENMTGKQCFLVCPLLGNTAIIGNSVFRFVRLWET